MKSVILFLTGLFVLASCTEEYHFGSQITSDSFNNLNPELGFSFQTNQSRLLPATTAGTGNFYVLQNGDTLNLGKFATEFATEFTHSISIDSNWSVLNTIQANQVTAFKSTSKAEITNNPSFAVQPIIGNFFFDRRLEFFRCS